MPDASLPPAFDPNEGATKSALTLPGAPTGRPTYSAEHYLQHFEQMAKASDFSSVGEMIKSLNVPPSSLAFSRISYMPESYNKGVLQWPGIAPEALGKIAKENIVPQMVIGMRCDDVMRYSQVSNQTWRPGWRITIREEGRHPTEAERKDILAATRFLTNCNIETRDDQARQRDQGRINDFPTFLSKITRDSLTFDLMATWTDMDSQDRVRSFAAMPAANIRFAGPAGYEDNPDLFAVMVDEGGGVQHSFSRDELSVYTRNPRTDQIVGPYGYPEIEISVRLIQGFQNALDMNINRFSRSAIPNGILTLSGGTVTQRQLDILNRVWMNLKQGVTKSWALPVIGLNGDSKLDLLDLSKIAGMEAFYEDLMNMVVGAFCTIYRFPVRRLGYRISGGHGKDTEPWPGGSETEVDDSDPGLPPLLTHLENYINEYLVWSRYPHLAMGFTGKSPKEDARSYQSRENSMTWGEKRASNGMVPLEETIEEADLKLIAKLMAMAPTDPNLSGIFQTVAGAFIASTFGEPGGEGGAQATPGSRMTHQKDPATSEAHGHLGGVRRNSKAEGGGKH